MRRRALLLGICTLLACLACGASAEPPVPPAVITISAAGDVTIGADTRKRTNLFAAELARQEGDLGFPFRNVQAIFSHDDLTLVNLECALTNRPSATQNTFSFAGKPEHVQALVLGSVEAVALDNNHVFDHGVRGYADTQEALHEAGIVFSGNGEAGILEARGVKIGMLSYRTFDGGYARIRKDMPGAIAALRAQGCSLVIVSYHWGAEREYTPNQNQVTLGRETIDAGADLVLGHHSHCINPIERYKGKYICYSLANFSFAGNSNPADKDTFIFQQRFLVTADGVQDAGIRIVPCRISSVTERNDFMPTPYEAEDAQRVADKLVTLGEKLPYALRAYPLDWTRP